MSPTMPRFLSALCICVCLTASQVLAGGAIRIAVKERATVRGEKVLLGDIARFQPADGERVRRMKRLEVASSPPPGRTATLSDRFLMYRLYAELKREEGIKVKIPKQLLVERECVTIGVGQQKRIFRQYVLEHASWPPEKIHFERIRVAYPIRLPSGRVDWEVKGPARVRAGDLSVVVVFRVDGVPQRKISLSGRISVDQCVVKAARALRAGTVLTAEDLFTVTERRIRPAGNVFGSSEGLMGMRITRGLRAGEPVTKQMVEPVPLVLKGRRVLIKAENEQIRITTFGKALQDGARGDQIRVVNLSSGKEIHATVKGPGQVEVFF